MSSDDLLSLGVGGTELAEYLAKRTVFVNAALGRAGATSGFTNASDTGEARVPQSQTASTFVLPLTGLKKGDIVSKFKVIAQIESGGNTVTLDADLRKLTNVAADPTDASLGAITQVSVTADTAVSSEKELSTAEVIASGEQLYVLFTVTTGASCDVRLLGVEVTVNTFGGE